MSPVPESPYKAEIQRLGGCEDSVYLRGRSSAIEFQITTRHYDGL